VPEEKNYGKMIRDLFYAPEGYKLVVADYSQIEPRIIASMSGDPIMLENYRIGGDIYTTVGNTMGVDRKAGKVLVLAIAYGVGPDKISRQIGCTIQEAKTLLTDFAAKFPSVDLYRAKVIGVARNTGYVSTILKRRRYLPDIKSKVPAFRSSAERQAFNTRIQGSAADIIKLAMIRAYEKIPAEARIILTVHDEIVTLTPDSVVDQTREAIREAMEEIYFLDVPLIADIKVVQKWGDAKG
jgi:DNA polymerase-1